MTSPRTQSASGNGCNEAATAPDDDDCSDDDDGDDVDDGGDDDAGYHMYIGFLLISIGCLQNMCDYGDDE